MIPRARHDDSGAVAVLVAILATVLIAISALAVDVGYWYACKRQLQSAADAAALAGAIELGHKGTDAAIEAVVQDYAQRNFGHPLYAADSAVASTEIGSDYVKVTVETNAKVFLAQHVLGRGTTLIRAQAVAKLGWLAAGRAPVPWGLSILKIGEMHGVLGGETVEFTENQDGYWEGAFSQGRVGPLTIEALNGQGYTDVFSGVLTIGSIPAGGRITAFDVDKSTLTSGVDTSVLATVELASPLAAGGKVEADVGGAKTTLTPAGTNTFSGYVPVGTTPDPYKNLTLTVTVREGSATQSVSCGLLLRRANYILQDVDAHPIAVTATDSVGVYVKTLDFTYGDEIELKVEGGTGTTGNFQALDFATLDHSACGFPIIGTSGQSGGADYRENIVGNTDVVAHLYDYVTTKPGDMVGPTKQGVDERLAGVMMQTLEEWEATGRPETKQLCVIPICERYEDQTGRSVLQIVSFATFFLESKVVGNDMVIGHFIEWTDPGWFVVDSPPDDLATFAVHLTTEHLDY